MGLEQLIPNDLEPGTEETIWVQPLSWHWVRTMKEQIIVDEVLASGLSPDKLFRPIAFVKKDDDGIIEIIIGDIPPPFEFLGVVWGVDADLSKEENGIRTFVRTWHMLISAPSNPMEIHWRQRSGAEPTISIEGIERTKKTTQVAKYARELSYLMPRLTEILRARPGRPPGVEPSPEEFEQMKIQAITYLELDYRREKIAELLGIEDTKTLRKYLKIWGIN